MSFELIRRADLTVTPWRNNAGRKADIAAGAGWHVGFAMLDRDAPFSDFTGQDRTITLVDGPGFALSFAPPQASLVVRDRFAPAAFDGGWPTHCHINGGACVVLNAMTARATHSHVVTVLPPDAVPDLANPGEGLLFLIVLAGMGQVSAADRQTTLGLHDAVRVHGPIEINGAPGLRFCMIRVVAA